MMYRERITLKKASVATSALGVPVMGTPTLVEEVWASVQRMSATKTMITFQQADIIGLDIEFRSIGKDFNAIEWEGHSLHFAAPEDVNNRGRIIRLQAYYQIDDPKLTPAAQQ